MNTSRPLLADLSASYEQHVRSRDVQEETIHRHMFCLNIFLDYLKDHGTAEHLPALTPVDIAAFTCDYAENHGVDCRRHMRTTLRSFLRFAYRQKFLRLDLSAAVPSIRIYRLSRAPRPISEQAIKALIEAIDTQREAGSRDLAIIQLLRIYGVRAIQIRKMTLSDIDWHNNAIHFPAAKNGRLISEPLAPEAGNAIADYLKRFRCKKQRFQEIFLTIQPQPRPLGAATISNMIRRRLTAANVALQPGVKPGAHAFRYACVTRMLAANCSLKVVADLLGHRSYDSVNIYNKLDTKALRTIPLPWPEDLS